jgi:hypothetical protein
VLGLSHQSAALEAGLAQCVFQLAIAAPLFWAGKIVSSETQLRRVLWLIFLANAASASLGVLQAYAPERFLPPEFSALALRLNPAAVEAVTYQGPDGRDIVRPPGLTDLPGGAAVAGMFAGFLGLALSAGATRLWRAVTFGAAGVGLVALYLTQVRSLFLAAVAGVLLLAFVLARQGRGIRSVWIGVTGLAAVVLSFLWAASVGGESISERFLGIAQEGLLAAYQENRGIFLSYTLGELLNQFPFGAGVGRWGMMQTYFGDPANWRARPIYVELQITGWLLDGGIALCLAYVGAIAAAMRFAYRATLWPHPTLSYWAAVVLAIQFMLAALAMTGPAFNTQLGIYFWLVSGVLAGAVDGTSRQLTSPAPGPAQPALCTARLA